MNARLVAFLVLVCAIFVQADWATFDCLKGENVDAVESQSINFLCSVVKRRVTDASINRALPKGLTIDGLKAEALRRSPSLPKEITLSSGTWRIVLEGLN